MSRTGVVLLRFTGSLFGFLIGCWLAYVAVAGLLSESEYVVLGALFNGIPAGLLGGAVGAAMMPDNFEQRGSFWTALGAAVGTVAPVIGTVVGAVI